MAYASATDWIVRVDTQIIGDLITDDDPESGERVRPSRDEILASPVVSALLDDASGRIEAALRAGKRYTPTQLSGLTGNALSHLKRVTCTIATALGFDRRPERSTQDVADRYREQADKLLIDLASGKNILGLADETDVNAGLINTAGPTSLDVTDRNMLSERMGRMIPDSKQRYPLSRG